MRLYELFKKTLIAAMVAGVAACGGGDDDDDGGVSGTEFDGVDAEVAAAYTLEIVSQLADFSQVSADVLLEGVTPLAARAIQSSTEACELGGRIDITWDDQDDDGELSVGDVVTVDFVNCVVVEETDDVGTVTDTATITGRLQGLVTAAGPASATYAVEFTGLAIDENVLDGTVNLQVVVEGTTTTITMTGGPLDMTPGSDSTARLTQTDFTNVLDLGTGSYTLAPNGRVDGTVSGSGLAYVMTTILAFQGEDDDFPFTGELEAVADDGSTLTLTTLDSSTVRVTVDGESTEVSWEELDDALDSDSDSDTDTTSDSDSDTTTDSDTDTTTDSDTDTTTDSDTDTTTDSDSDSTTDDHVIGQNVWLNKCDGCHSGLGDDVNDPSDFGVSSGWPDRFLADLGSSSELNFGEYDDAMSSTTLSATEVNNLVIYLRTFP